ncbi:MAG TPA: DUF192 domain-containing protein [Verrucomicrobiae bacterium]|nr:DUF192 domain-containing protein [Verrucomicrobiae bacterium]
MKWLSSLFLAVTVLAGGCQKPATSSTPAPAAGYPSLPTAAQAKLPTINLWIRSEPMVAETALTEIQRETGMMFRTNMAENEGMVFVFPAPYRASFWIMQTELPLSAAYIDPEGVILEIHDLQPHNTNSVVAGSDNVQYVLETRQGWFQRHGIKEGTVIGTEKGPLKKAFFGR